MRSKSIFSLLLAALLILPGCSAKKPRPWVDLADISSQVTKDEKRSAVVDAVQVEETKASEQGPKVKDLSVHKNGGNKYLSRIKSSSKEGPRIVKDEEGIQLNFDNADIYEVIQVITDTLDINYIVDPAVKGTVNVRSSKKVPQNKLFRVFKKILNINGLNIRNEGEYYYIYPAKKASTLAIYGPNQARKLKESPRMIIQVMPLMHISASAAIKLTEPYLSEHGSLYELPDLNTLIIADFESKVLDVLMILARLDVSPLSTLSVRLVRVEKAPLFTLRDELVEILNALKVNKKDHEGVTVLPLERVNSLLLVGSNESLLESTQKWIMELDVMPSEGRDNIYVYNVRNSVASDLAGLVNDLISGKSSSTRTAAEKPKNGSLTTSKTETKPPTIPRRTVPSTPAAISAPDLGFAGEPALLPDDSRNIILIRALPPDYGRLVKLLERLDNIPRQVLIEVMIAEVKLSDSWQMGVEWSLKETNRLKINDSKYSNTYNFGQGISDFTGFTYNALNSAGEVVGLIQAIATDNDLTILSSPQLMVLNNETASINVGDQVPILTTQTSGLSSTGSDITTETVQYKDTGVILTVTPKINYDGIIILDIEQQVSTAAENDLGGSTSPIISSRELKTKLAVKNGQSILMGGLIETEKNIIENGIPILKNIPFLGWLFKSHEEITDKTELIVLITPYVIESESVLDQYIERFQEKMNELRNELKGEKS